MIEKIRMHGDTHGWNHDRPSLDMEDRFVQVISRGTGVEVKVLHGLGRKPQGAHPLNCPGGVCYYDTAGKYGSAWTETMVAFTPQTAAGVSHWYRLF